MSSSIVILVKARTPIGKRSCPLAPCGGGGRGDAIIVRTLT